MIHKVISYIKNPSNKKIIENIFSLGFLKMATMLLPLIIIPHLINTIGLKLVGLLAIVTSISAYFNTLIDYGFVYTGTREVAQNKLDINKNTFTFYIVTYSKLVLIIVSFLLILLSSILISFIKDNLALLLLSVLNISLISLAPTWFFQGVEDMKKIAFGEVAGKFVSFFLIIFFVDNQRDILLIPLFYVLGQFVSILVYIYYLKKYIILSAIPSYNNRLIIEKLRESWNMFINILFPNFYNNYSYLILGYFSSLADVAVYDIIRKIMSISEQAMGILSKVYFPVLSNNFSKFLSFLRVMLFAAILLMVFQLVFIQFGIYYFESKNITIDNKMLYLQSIAPVVYGLMTAYGINSLGVNNHDRELRNITVVTSVIGFLVVTILTYFYDSLGALSGVLLTWLIRAVMCYFLSTRIESLKT